MPHWDRLDWIIAGTFAALICLLTYLAYAGRY